MKDLEAVDEFAILLREIEAREDVGMEPIFHLKVSCEMNIVEFTEVRFHFISSSLLHEG